MLQTILVPFDGSSLSEQATRYAVELARAAAARLVLVGLARVDHHPRRGLSDGHRTAPGDDVHGHAETLRRDGLVVDTAFAPGEPPDGLLAEIERRQPDLVVMGTLGRSGLGRWRRDRLTEAVVARGGRPVLLVCAWAPPTAANTPRLRSARIVVPLDGSALAEAALPTAVQLARALDSEVLLVQAIAALHLLPYVLRRGPSAELDVALLAADREDAAGAYLERLADRLLNHEHGLRVSTLVRLGGLPALIRDLARAEAAIGKPTGLVVMATGVRRGVAGVDLGNAADATLCDAGLPVVVVSPPEAAVAREPAFRVATTAQPFD